MVGKAPSPPDPPDPVATAAAQADANRQALRDSQINQVTPFGNTTFSGDFDTGDRTLTQTLSGPGQEQLDITNRAATNQLRTIEDILGTAPPRVDQDFRAQQTQNILDRLTPALDRRRSQAEAQLATQGIPLGSEAFSAGQEDLSRAENDIFLGADAAAGNEAAQQFQLESASRQTPINELIALLSNTQVALPNFQQTAGPLPVDRAGIEFASAGLRNQNFQQESQNRNAFNQGLFGLGGSALGAGGLFFGRKFA